LLEKRSALRSRLLTTGECDIGCCNSGNCASLWWRHRSPEVRTVKEGSLPVGQPLKIRRNTGVFAPVRTAASREFGEEIAEWLRLDSHDALTSWVAPDRVAIGTLVDGRGVEPEFLKVLTNLLERFPTAVESHLIVALCSLGSVIAE
jgi:hypothetical protein